MASLRAKPYSSARCLRWRDELEADPIDAFPGTGHQKPLEEENRCLRRELDIAREERDILKKVPAVHRFGHPRNQRPRQLCEGFLRSNGIARAGDKTKHRRPNKRRQGPVRGADIISVVDQVDVGSQRSHDCRRGVLRLCVWLALRWRRFSLFGPSDTQAAAPQRAFSYT